MQMYLKNIILSCFILLSLTTLYAKDVTLVSYIQNPVIDNLQPFQAEKIIISNIIYLQNKNSGATYNIRWGNLENQNLYVVSLFPDLGVVIDSKEVNKSALQTFIEKNINILLNPRCVVGTWYNKDNNKTYLDVSAVFFDKHLAIELANKYNQIAIWDLKEMKEIKTEGDGKPLKDLPPIEDRIPPLK